VGSRFYVSGDREQEAGEYSITIEYERMTDRKYRDRLTCHESIDLPDDLERRKRKLPSSSSLKSRNDEEGKTQRGPFHNLKGSSTLS
jgi:hypothetical protein